MSNSVRDPSGLVVVASVSFGESEEPPKATDVLAFIPLKGKEIKYKCGHKGPEKFKVDFYGVRVQPNFTGKERLRVCPACRVEEVKKFSIRCASCRHIILPGDGVALYVNDKSFDQAIAHKVKTGETKSVLGCLRMDCCPSGGFFAGHWTEEGFKPAHDSGLSAAAEAFATGKVVISNT